MASTLKLNISSHVKYIQSLGDVSSLILNKAEPAYLPKPPFQSKDDLVYHLTPIYA